MGGGRSGEAASFGRGDTDLIFIKVIKVIEIVVIVAIIVIIVIIVIIAIIVIMIQKIIVRATLVAIQLEGTVSDAVCEHPPVKYHNGEHPSHPTPRIVLFVHPLVTQKYHIIDTCIMDTCITDTCIMDTCMRPERPKDAKDEAREARSQKPKAGPRGRHLEVRARSAPTLLCQV